MLLRDKNRSFLYVCLALVALLNALLHFNESALVWPVIDNLPSVMRIFDSSVLTNDFFTNTSESINPRTPYSILLYVLTYISPLGIGGGLAIIQSAICFILPIVFVIFVLESSCKSSIEKEDVIDCSQKIGLVIFALVVASFFALQSRFGGYLSVAWWAPISVIASPQNVSIIFSLIGSLFLFKDKTLIGGFFAAFAIFIHPVIAMYSFVLAYICLGRLDLSSVNRGNLKVLAIYIILPLLAVKILFGSDSKLLSEDFVNIYAHLAHPSHYIPSRFGSLIGGLEWYVSFSFVSIYLTLVAICLRAQKDEMWKNCSLALFIYVSSIFLQYAFVELIPLKLVAIFGPSRFSMFGAWFCVVFSIRIAANYLSVRDYPGHLNLIESVPRLMWCILVLGVVSVFLLLTITSSKLPESEQAKMDTYHIVSDLMEEEDVISVPFSSITPYIPILAKRAVFVGNGFPFNEASFLEYRDRFEGIYGSAEEIMNAEGAWVGEKHANYYRALSPSDFVDISKKFRLDFVAIEKGYSMKFSSCKAELETDSFVFFTIHSLSGCS